MVTQYKNLIGGEMVATDRWLDVVNPANEQVIGQVPACGKAELDRAVAAARAAFKTWKNTPIEERRAAIMAISGAIKANAEELYRLLTSEQGKPHDQAKGEIYGAAGMSAAQSTLSLDDEINEDSDTRLSRTRRVPVGVVGGIVPWNFPVMILTTPGGTLSAISSAMRNVVSGVKGEGFSTMVQPESIAGTIFWIAIMTGKFHGTMPPTTPTGTRRVRDRRVSLSSLISSSKLRVDCAALIPAAP